MLGQPLLEKSLALLLECFHATLKMCLQPIPAMNGEELHTLWYRSTLVYATNHVRKGLVAASAEIHLGTSSAVMIRDVASTESELSDSVF